MYYHVTAEFKSETAPEFLQKLQDGTIQDQKPDGAEICSAMNRAVLNSNGEIEFSIICYCSTPLAHERSTVLDHHFENLNTEIIENHQEYTGRPFMDCLQEITS